MRPRKRYLKGNAGTEGPTSLLFFDTESYQPKPVPGANRQEMTLRLWVAAYVRREGDSFREPVYHRGRTGPEFWALVERLSDWRKPLWAFAHNLPHDLTQLGWWDQLETWRWTAGPVERQPDPETGKTPRPWRGRLCLEGRPTFLVVRGRRGVLKLVDTGNYWPQKLDQVGARYGLPKLDMPAWDAPDEDWWRYCTRDVDVCRVAVTNLMTWWLKEDCGVFQMTAPSLAMRHFQHTCDRRAKDGQAVNIVLEDDSPARPIERASYMGGRIEPFYVGQVRERVYKLDCNSLYLAVMRGELYPRKRVRRLLDPTPHSLARHLSAFAAVADVLINTGPSWESYPTKGDGLQVHQCGRFWTTLPTPELVRALANGHVERVGECHLYSVAALFREWADYWYARKLDARKRADQGEEEFAKLVGLSLSGKFGQRGEWWVDAPERAPRLAWGLTFRKDYVRGVQVQYRYVAGHTQKKVPGQEPGNAFPAISAHVTSYARELMRRAFAVMPERSLLYTATDSIITTEPGYRALVRAGWVDPEELGKFRLEDVYESAEICGPNWYRVGDRWTVSGLHGRCSHGPNGEAIVEVWDHLPSMLHTNPGGRCGINRVELRALRPTHKNAPAGDGWRRPFRVTGDADFTDCPPRLRDRWVKKEF